MQRSRPLAKRGVSGRVTASAAPLAAPAAALVTPCAAPLAASAAPFAAPPAWPPNPPITVRALSHPDLATLAESSIQRPSALRNPGRLAGTASVGGGGASDTAAAAGSVGAGAGRGWMTNCCCGGAGAVAACCAATTAQVSGRLPIAIAAAAPAAIDVSRNPNPVLRRAIMILVRSHLIVLLHI